MLSKHRNLPSEVPVRFFDIDQGLEEQVSTKVVEQKSCLMLHRARHLFIRQQTAVINSIHGYVAEFGIVAPVGRRGVEQLLGAPLGFLLIRRNSAAVLSEVRSPRGSFESDLLDWPALSECRQVQR